MSEDDRNGDRATREEEEPRRADGELTEEELDRLEAEAVEKRERALAQVVKFGDPVLRSRASEVSEFDDRLRDEVERMIQIMRDGMGVGLAATQLGVLRRLLVFQAGPDAPATALINPRIEWSSDEDALADEGCLSLPRVVVEVERPLHIRVAAHDPAGEPISIEASGLEARVIQHEVDHLDGVLILDRTERAQRKGALRALREGTAYLPPGSEEPEGESEDDPERVAEAGEA